VSLAVGLGIILGLAGALTTARSMRSLLFGIEPWDPASQAATVAALALVAVAAAWIPARRAMRVDPAIVLRNE
jgi:ABC-type antimicrobial peptide transport system permease subunit